MLCMSKFVRNIYGVRIYKDIILLQYKDTYGRKKNIEH